MAGRILAIGDIHGCLAALNRLLDLIEPGIADTIVILGDVVDRGPDSRGVINRLRGLQNECNMVYLMGNHEEMMCEAATSIAALNSWLDIGGLDAIKSYGGQLTDIPQNHFDFVAAGRDYWKTDSEIFVHANLQANVPLEKQTGQWLRWKRVKGSEPPYDSKRRVICGHSSQKTGTPLEWNGWICIDTWAYGGGYLSCLDVETNELTQVSQEQQIRRLQL